MAIIGYIRVSSAKQTLEHQRFEIENFAPFSFEHGLRRQKSQDFLN